MKEKILIISSMYTPYEFGGAEISTKLLAENLDKTKFEVTILTSGFEERIEIKNGIKIIRININNYSKFILRRYIPSNVNNFLLIKMIFSNFYSKSYYKKYKQILIEENYKLIHTSNNLSNFGLFMLWKASNELGIKIVHTLRDPFLVCLRIDRDRKAFFGDRLFRIFSRYYVKKVDFIHSPSKFMIDLHRKYDFSFKKFKIIPNAIQEIEIQNNRKEKIILYVGAIEPHKGIDFLLDAFKKTELQDYKLVLIGEGSLFKKRKEENNIKFLGRKTHYEVMQYMQKSRITILPSQWDEAFGRVLIEAVFNNCLPLGSDRGAIPEVLLNNREYIFLASSSEELSNKIKKIISLSESEYYYRIKNMKVKMKSYILKNQIKEFEELYLKILNSNK